MRKTMEWLRKKCDKQVAEYIYEIFTHKENIKPVLAKAKKVELILSGKNIAERIKSPKKVCGVVLKFKIPKGSLDEAKEVIEAISRRIPNAEIMWFAKTIPNIKKCFHCGHKINEKPKFTVWAVIGRK